MTLTSGTRLGAYEITGSVGAGGMGEVFRARDTRLGRDVAIKVLPALFAADADRLRRFEQEARAAAALNHPNILVGLRRRRRGRRAVRRDRSCSRARRCATRLDARRAARAQGRSTTRVADRQRARRGAREGHRPPRPEARERVRHEGRPRQDPRLRPGEAGRGRDRRDAAAATIAAPTEPGIVLGTVGYMSPEQVRGEAVDARSDIFASARCSTRCSPGRRAFKGETAVETMSAILREDPPDVRGRSRTCPPALERIVRRCLEKNPDERFQSARDLAFALDALSSASGVKRRW